MTHVNVTIGRADCVSDAQYQFLRNTSDNAMSLFLGGWSSGKSWVGLRKLILIHGKNKCPSFMVAPTWSDMGRTMIEPFKEICEAWQLKYDIRMSGSKNYNAPHIMLFGRPIILWSAEKPERITGVNCGSGLVDEACRIWDDQENPTRCPWVQIQGRMRVLGAIKHLILTSTPEGTGTWVHRNFIAKPLKRTHVYLGKTSDNRFNAPDFIDNLKSTLPPELLEQYINGMAVDFTGKPAHPDFTQDNIKEMSIYEGDRALGTFHIGLDFNCDEMGWVAAQSRHDGSIYFYDESYIEKDARIDNMVKICHSKNWATRRHVTLWPDLSGKNRRTQGDPEIATVVKCARDLQWDLTCKSDGANPEVASRINLVNSLILTADGKRRLFVSPRCTHLIEQFRRAPRDSNGSYKKDRQHQWNHMDSMGYVCYGLFPPIRKSMNWIPGRP